jgi:pyruvate dehydrogenase E1 component alpha subunit
MDGHTLLKLYRQMLLIRRFEEEAARAYTERQIGGFLHLYAGQEAVCCGVIETLEPQDYVFTAYRDHGHYLARGGNARAGMAELFGKDTGCSRGRGGSMHFFYRSHNFMGGYGIIGAHVPIAAGVAFAAKYKQSNAVTVCFLGEGAVSIGPFHEGLSLAALWKLPIVFIIENNFYAMGTPLYRTLPVEDASVRALGYPMARAAVDGCDIEACFNAAKHATERARNESLPMLLEYKTYRYRGHSMADPGKYRTKEEVESWRARDPLLATKKRLESEYPDLAQAIEPLAKAVEEEIADAVRFAKESASPEPNSINDFVYV